MKTYATQVNLNKKKDVISLPDQYILSCLTQLHLSGIKAEYIRQDELRHTMDALPFEERFLMLVNAEQTRRENNKREKSRRKACLRDKTAGLEDIKYEPARNIDRKFIARISDCSFIKESRDLLITGASGAGKTFISSALGVAACDTGFSVRA